MPPPRSSLRRLTTTTASCPSRPRPEVTWIDRKADGEALVEAVAAAAFDAPDHFGWVACDNRTTRAVAKILREDYGIARKSTKAQAYWSGVPPGGGP